MDFMDIPHYDNYEITEDGIIRNKKTKRILKPYNEKGKYPRVTLIYKKRLPHKVYVQYLISLALWLKDEKSML